jgi:hypothetical protein
MSDQLQYCSICLGFLEVFKVEGLPHGQIPRRIRFYKVSDQDESEFRRSDTLQNQIQRGLRPLNGFKTRQNHHKKHSELVNVFKKKTFKILAGINNTTRGVRPRFFRAFTLLSAKLKKEHKV